MSRSKNAMETKSILAGTKRSNGERDWRDKRRSVGEVQCVRNIGIRGWGSDHKKPRITE